MLIFQGALRNAIATFVHVSPTLKDTIWSLLEQYDLPVVVGPPAGNIVQPISPVSFLSHFFQNIPSEYLVLLVCLFGMNFTVSLVLKPTSTFPFFLYFPSLATVKTE